MRILLYSVLVLLITAAPSAAWDPLGLVRGLGNIKDTAQIVSDALDRSLSQVRDLQDRTDADVRDYLNQIEQIAAQTVQGVEASSLVVLQQAERSALALERQIYTDFRDLIFQIECAGDRVLLSTLQQSLANAINLIRRSSPKLRIMGITIAEGVVEPVDVVNPDLAYSSVKRARLKSILGSGAMTAEDDPYVFVSAYANIARLARQSRCHYVDAPDVAALFTGEIREMNRLIRPWIELGVRL